MVAIKPIDLDGKVVLGITVALPKTHLTMITTERGYVMCGALDVALLNERLADRGIIAGRALGVKTLDELLNAPLSDVTHSAEKLGIRSGMIAREALRLML